MFKDIFKELLQEKGLNQKQFSKLSQIPYTTITGWTHLNRLPDYTAIKKIADFFEITTDRLLEREDEYGNIKPSNKPYSELNYTEYELITDFRKLSTSMQEIILNTQKLMIETAKKAK